jgi:hypothetical protein
VAAAINARAVEFVGLPGSGASYSGGYLGMCSGMGSVHVMLAWGAVAPRSDLGPSRPRSRPVHL